MQTNKPYYNTSNSPNFKSQIYKKPPGNQNNSNNPNRSVVPLKKPTPQLNRASSNNSQYSSKQHVEHVEYDEEEHVSRLFNNTSILLNLIKMALGSFGLLNYMNS
jgi:hypothetical protein